MGAEAERAYYPGLNNTSTDLWRRWLHYYENDFSSYAYNVRVGQGIQPAPGLSEADKAVWKAITQKRIDVVAERFRETWIIEITERVVSASVGQLIVYEHLARQYYPVNETVRRALICARLGHDMAAIVKAQNILVFFFPPAGAPSFPPLFQPNQLNGPGTA